MASEASHDHNEIPVVWLLAPVTLQPAPDPIRPIPIAISATLVTLTFLALTILYNKKPKGISAKNKDIELETLKASIRVIRPTSAVQPSTIPLSSQPAQTPPPQQARAPPPCPSRSPSQSQTESGSDAISEPPVTVKTYHDALEDIRDTSYNSSSRRPSLATTTASSYCFSPDSTIQGDTKAGSPVGYRIVRPASSDYSVSIGPTPLPSVRGSVRNREINGAWARLRLGSEYDGDRTFVPSEANLQLGKGKGGAKWN